jgi:hypothetical protein
MMSPSFSFSGGRRLASKVYFTTDILDCHGAPDRKYILGNGAIELGGNVG